MPLLLLITVLSSKNYSSSDFGGEVAPQNSRFNNQPDSIELICSCHQWGVLAVGTAVMVWQEKGVINLFVIKRNVEVMWMG